MKPLRISALHGVARVAVVSALVTLVLAWVSCGGESGGVRTLRDIEESGKLIIITRNAPTTYYKDRDGLMAGVEYEMATSFAAWLGVICFATLVMTYLSTYLIPGAHAVAQP